jgi:hypothetical protein
LLGVVTAYWLQAVTKNVFRAYLRRDARIDAESTMRATVNAEDRHKGAAEAAPTLELMTFKPGQSGNPDGRPKGARNRATIAAEQLPDG